MRALRAVVSARDSGARLSEQAPRLPIDDEPGSGHGARLFVDTTRRFQALEGFGGAFTEAAAVTWLALPPEAREQ
jgi:glucosylceramidase